MRSTIYNVGNKLFLLFILTLSGFYSIAQDGSTSQANSEATHTTTSVTTEAMWYENPIVWVIGGAVLLMIIVAIARSGKSNVSNSEVTRTTTTTTTIKED